MSSGNAVSSLSGLIPFDTVCEKKRGVALADFGKEEFDKPPFRFFCYHFCKLFGSGLELSYKFRNCLINFFKKT